MGSKKISFALLCFLALQGLLKQFHVGILKGNQMVLVDEFGLVEELSRVETVILVVIRVFNRQLGLLHKLGSVQSHHLYSSSSRD